MQPNVRQDKILDIFYDFFSKKIFLSCALLVAARVGSVNSGGPMIAHTVLYKKTRFLVCRNRKRRSKNNSVPCTIIRNSGYGLRLVIYRPTSRRMKDDEMIDTSKLLEVRN